MLSAIISTNTNTLILPKPKLYSRSFSDHFSWSGPAPTEVGADVDYAAEVGDDCGWDARMPGRARWRHNLRKVILLHIHPYSRLIHWLSWRSMTLVDRRSRVRYPGIFYLFLRLIAWMVAWLGAPAARRDVAYLNLRVCKATT